MLSWAALSWVELSSVTLIVLNWNAELSCVELGIWQGLHWLITDDNWGIPLGASAMTVDASEVAQRSLFGDYYWTMWSLFNSTIEQCEVCSIGDYYWTMWSLFSSAIEQCVVCSIGDYYWTMWSLFSSTVEQCEVRSIVQSLDSLEWIQFQISAPPSSIFIARIWTRMRMRWSIGPMMLVTRITNTSGAMGTTRETGLVWDIFTIPPLLHPAWQSQAALILLSEIAFIPRCMTFHYDEQSTTEQT